MVIRKKTILVVLAGLIVFGGLTALCLTAAITPAAALNGMTVVIDPGHGGIDGGVVGTNTRKKESDINLGISLSLRHFLREAGYNVVMTRTSDVDLAGGAKPFKKSDMLARKKIIDDSSPDFVLSVHQNSYPRKDISGAQVFYAPGSEEGKENADKVQSVLNGALDSDRTAKSGDYYILQCSPVPSLLVECGFLSNPTEEALLVTADYQQKVAYALCSSIRILLEGEIDPHEGAEHS